MVEQQPGGPSRRTTLTDVAAAAGVSTALASIVMRGAPGASAQTRARVLAIADKLGYRPDQRARLLRQQRSRLLGVCFGVEHAFHGDLLDAVYRAADSRKYDVTLSAVTASRSEHRAVEVLLADRCEALLLFGSVLSVAELASLRRRLPVVVLTRRLPDTGIEPAIDSVHTADTVGLQLAVRHLVELGHRRIAHLDGREIPGAEDRRTGYREAMAAAGLAEHIRIVPAGATEADGASAIRTLLAADPPTAVIAFNDRCATGVLDTLLRRGVRVPQQMSVVGYDDDRLSRLSHVNLTTVGQDIDLLGRLAVERAVARLDPDFTAEPELVTPPHLLVRSTTAPPPVDDRPRPSGRTA